jgi:hypothetical protein
MNSESMLYGTRCFLVPSSPVLRRLPPCSSVGDRGICVRDPLPEHFAPWISAPGDDNLEAGRTERWHLDRCLGLWSCGSHEGRAGHLEQIRDLEVQVSPALPGTDQNGVQRFGGAIDIDGKLLRLDSEGRNASYP